MFGFGIGVACGWDTRRATRRRIGAGKLSLGPQLRGTSFAAADRLDMTRSAVTSSGS